MNLATAGALLKQQCAADTYPELSTIDLYAILNDSVAYTTWVAGTAYTVGQIIAPTVPNGHVYRVIVGGTSGATEPFWPLYSTSDSRIGLTVPYWSGMLPGSQLTDGTVTLVEAGPLPAAPWDIRRATYQAWNLKAQRASADVDFRAGQLQVNSSQVATFCLKMAQKYAISIA